MGIPTPRVRFQRPESVSGATYKIQPAIMDDPIYITINNAEFDGQLRPVEIFVNSKNMQSFQWINVLMRLISAQLQQPGPFPAFVVSELLDSYDPEGGYFIPKQGKVNSVAAHIGTILKAHCEALGLLDQPKGGRK